MGTPLSSSGELRPTRDVNERERKLIRESTLSYKELAEMFGITEKQVLYFRAKDSRSAKPDTRAFSEDDNALLQELYEQYGWKPAKIAQSFPGKTYEQVYRKMVREFKGR